jgi:hypothetical protein
LPRSSGDWRIRREEEGRAAAFVIALLVALVLVLLFAILALR